MVVNHVKMEDEDHLDVQFWQSKSASQRMQEVTRLRVNYHTWLNGLFLPWENYQSGNQTNFMIFEKDFVDFIELLNIHQVEYMIIGAHALAFHGRQDIPVIWIYELSRA